MRAAAPITIFCICAPATFRPRPTQSSIRAAPTQRLLARGEQVIGIDNLSATATAEAGIYGPALDKALRAQNVVLGHYPQSFEFSTLGGWIAHRGAGQQSSRYGRAHDWLVSAKLATPRGLLTTEDFPGSSAGPRLTDLVLGSEGAFGVITEATVRVQPAPAESLYTGFLFRDFASGTAAIRHAVQEGVCVAMLRLSDAEETRFYRAYGAAGKRKTLGSRIADAVLRYRNFGDGAAAMIAGFEGDKALVERARNRFGEIAKQFGAIAIGDSAGKRWYQGRFHGPYLRDPLMDRGLGVDTLETATSWSKLDALYAAVKNTLEDTIRETAPRPGARGIIACHISHSYPDGASLYFTCSRRCGWCGRGSLALDGSGKKRPRCRCSARHQEHARSQRHPQSGKTDP